MAACLVVNGKSGSPKVRAKLAELSRHLATGSTLARRLTWLYGRWPSMTPIRRS